jgi:hypothetical protein
LPADWTPDKAEQFQSYWDNLYSGQLGARPKLKFIPTGTANAYTEIKEPPLKSEFDEWLTRIVCFAFSYPPAAFLALSNRSTAEQHAKQAEEEGSEPLKLHIADMINSIVARRDQGRAGL